MVVEMGTHVLRSVPGMHLLVQLLPPGLEERARALPPLISTYSTPDTSPWHTRACRWAPFMCIQAYKSKLLRARLLQASCSFKQGMPTPVALTTPVMMNVGTDQFVCCCAVPGGRHLRMG